MEAKVDVRKLQLLNDRIMQTMEALNQVRVSVHGIGQNPHTSPYAQPGLGHSSAPFGGYGSIGPAMFGTPMGWPGAALGQNGYYGMGQYYGMPNGLGGAFGVPGISHTPYGAPQMGGWQPQLQWQQSPFNGYSQSPFGPWGQSAYGPGLYGSPMGLAHSGPYEEMERRMAEQRASDPGRLMHSFPYGAYV